MAKNFMARKADNKPMYKSYNDLVLKLKETNEVVNSMQIYFKEPTGAAGASGNN